MFVLRSAFWLAIGFMLVAPPGADFGSMATALRDDAVTAGINAGTQIIASRIDTVDALPMLFLAARQPTEPALLPEPLAAATVVLPHPRPFGRG